MSETSSPFRPVLLLIALAVGAVGLTVWQKGSDKELIPWRTDYDASRKEAGVAHKPTLVYFTASWCGPCQGMRQTTWNQPDVAKALASYVAVKLDVDQQGALAQRFGVAGVPHFVVFDPSGVKVAEVEGAMDAGQFLRWLPHGM